MEAALSLLAALSCALQGTSTTSADPDRVHWNQPFGTADLALGVELEPVAGPPEVLWEIDGLLPGTDLVCWAGVAFYLKKARTKTQIHAVRATTGEAAGWTDLGRVERVQLAVWQGMVAVVMPDQVQIVRWKDDKLRTFKRVRGEFEGIPRIVRGFLLIRSGSETVCIDLAAGREVGRFSVGSGLLSITRGSDEHALDVRVTRWGSKSGLQNTFLFSDTYTVGGLRPGRTEITCRRTNTTETMFNPGERRSQDAVSVDAGNGLTYFVPSLSNRRRATLYSAGGQGFLPSKIAGLGVLYNGGRIGFSAEGEFIVEHAQTDRLAYQPATEFPEGAEPHQPSRAGAVVYFGDWAIHSDGRRVLWSLPELRAQGRAIPAADHCVLVRTEDGRLVGLGDTPTERLADSSNAEATARLPADRPDRSDGLFLEEGRFVAGTVTRTQDEVAVKSKGNVVWSGSATDVCGTLREGELQRSGEEHPLYLAWRESLHQDVLESFFEELVDAYARMHHPAEGRRLAQEARERWNLDAGFVEQLEERLTGRTARSNLNAEGQREHVRRQEEKARQEVAGSYAEAARWLGEHGAPTAASALLADGLRFSPESKELLEQAQSFVPDHFPQGSVDRTLQWLKWANELLPAAAEFLDPTDARARRAPELWRVNTLALCTRNLVLFSFERDPAIVGACLRNGEGAVRALVKLHGETTVPLDEDPEPLVVLLHADRDAYLRERNPDGSYAMPWSAGYYSPAEAVSRFYVPRSELGEEQPMGRNLNEVLVHELTHHYVDRRWLGLGRGNPPRGNVPGFWIVEGFARFIEDQAVEMGRRGGKLDDPTVSSVEASAAALEVGALFPLVQLLDLTHADFATKLSDEHVLDVNLRNTLGRSRLSQRAIFYEQAGSLVFFLMNRAGAEGRAALLEYLARHYAGRLSRNSWEHLGAKEVEALEKSYHEFLRGL